MVKIPPLSPLPPPQAIEERLHSETGRVTYGLVATRALNFYEPNKLQEEGFYEEFVGSPANPLLSSLFHNYYRYNFPGCVQSFRHCNLSRV